jgi:hypothetical protein
MRLSTTWLLSTRLLWAAYTNWGESEVGINPLTEEDLRKLVLSTSRAILGRLPCLRLGDVAIEEMNSKYSSLLTRMQAI